ncbi:hypothetical protein I4F81_001103 [Pyropia yezoensis]|uniref:Uncharacterized protein n=1 Tax=Pyropia yezoensis TaxID=2788 RepID=A0ACC3BL04_PYRYE|nr:hypothetical protein I4F81_001103 [Neopyropia yezoensis]
MAMDTALLMVACMHLDIDPPAAFHPTDPGAAQYASVVRAAWPDHPPVTVQGALTEDLLPPAVAKRLRRLRLHERELWIYRHTSLAGGLPRPLDDGGDGGGDGDGDGGGGGNGADGGGADAAAARAAEPVIDGGSVAPCNRDAALTLWEGVFPRRTPYLHAGGLPLLHCLAASDELLVLQDLGPPSAGDANDDAVADDDGDGYRVAGAPNFAAGLTLEQAAAAAAALAHLHRSFAAPASRRGFPSPSPSAAAGALDRAVTASLAVGADGGDAPDGGGGAAFWAAAPPKVARWVADIHPLSAAAAARYACPRTVVHGEPLGAALRFWAAGAAGRLAAVAHWQQATVAAPATDIAVLFHAGLPPALRRDHEADLLRGYWRVLTGAGEGEGGGGGGWGGGGGPRAPPPTGADALATAPAPPPPYECTWEALRGDYVAAYELTALRLVRAAPLFEGSPEAAARLVASLTDLRKRRLGGGGGGEDA